jgi:uncharacterized membrane protein YagU involved in acid resistance
LRLSSRLVIGAIAGVVGTMAMTSAMRRLHARLPEAERYPLTPREIVDSTLEPDEAAARELTTASHFAYGAACGALLAAANPRTGTASGAGAGVAVWLASYMGWIPAFGILKPATGHPVRRNLLMIGVHLVWGAATAKAMRELSDAQETIFSGGDDRDVAGP